MRKFLLVSSLVILVTFIPMDVSLANTEFIYHNTDFMQKNIVYKKEQDKVQDATMKSDFRNSMESNDSVKEAITPKNIPNAYEYNVEFEYL